MRSPFSRRSLLALTGSGAAGLATAAHGRGTADGDRVTVYGEQRSHQPLPYPDPTTPTSIHATEAGGNLAVVAAIVPKLVWEYQPLIVSVRAIVPPEMVGRTQVTRVIMLSDSGEIRTVVATEHRTIMSAVFVVQVTAGDSRPLDDWNLIEERIFAVRASMNVVDQEAFAVSPDFWFKVRRA
jgi:hypothetical protein